MTHDYEPDQVYREGGAQSGLRHRAEEGIEQAQEALHKAQDVAQRAGERVSEAGSRVASRGREFAQEARAKSRHAADQIAETYERGKHTFENGLEHHPLALGIGFFVAGLVTGLAIPRTRRENRWFGDASEQIREKGYEIAHEGVEAGRRAFSAARDEAREQGLTPGQLGERASRVASEAADAARRRLRDDDYARADDRSGSGEGLRDIRRDAESELESVRRQF